MGSFTPGPWEVDDYCGTIIWAPNPYGEGKFHVADIRGWGHLTGRGNGGMGFPDEEAMKIQDANARLIAAAWEMMELLRSILTEFDKRELAATTSEKFVKLMDHAEDLLTRIEGEEKAR